MQIKLTIKKGLLRNSEPTKVKMKTILRYLPNNNISKLIKQKEYAYLLLKLRLTRASMLLISIKKDNIFDIFVCS